MKRIILTFSLILCGFVLFGQIPRIRLNQVQKDTVWGSILISSPVDSNLTYSRDFYIGPDTSLNFYGTVLVAGGGGGGSFITTTILSDSLANYILKVAGFGGDVSGTYNNITVIDDSHNHIISNVDGLQTALDGKLTSVNAGYGLTGSGTSGSALLVDTSGTIVSKNFYFANLPAGGGGTVTSVSAGTQISGMSMTISNGTTTPSIATSISDAANFRTAIGAGTLSSEVDGSVTNEGTLGVSAGTASTSVITSNTSGANGVTITAAGINSISESTSSNGGTITITATEVDGSISNEGSLSVGAGGANSSDIVSNTSGSTNVTIAGGSNVTVTESGSTITIASTGGGSSFNNLTETADTVFVSKFFNADTSTLYVDAINNRVGIGTTAPSVALEVVGSGLNITQTGSVSAMRLNRTDGKIIASSAGLGGGGFFYDSTGTFSISATSRATIESSSISGNALIRLSTTQNVGIKSTDPVYDLDVNGNVRADTYYYDVGSSLVSSSDARLKKNVSEMESSLNKINALNLVKYEWNDIMFNKLNGRSSQSKLSGIFEGMIAQEVESIFPEYVGQDADGYKTLSYVSFIVPLIKATQEQQAIIESQKTEIDQLKTQYNDLLQRIIQLENK